MILGIEKGRKTKNESAGTITVSQSESGIHLYDHQEKVSHQLNQKILKTNKNFAGLLVLPTGGGKTLTAAYWIAKNLLDKGKKVLWLAHRHSLLDQAKDTFYKKLAYKDIFQNKTSFNYRILSGIHDRPVNIQNTDDLIIASKDSLNAGFEHLYKKWIKNNSDEIFLVIDEAHHATAKTYRKLIENIKKEVSNFKMLGLTATPFRTLEEEKGHLAKIFPDDIIYKIDLKTLIRLGILAEPHFEEVSTGQNFSQDLSEEQIKKLSKGFDLDQIGGGIAKTIAENKERNWSIVNKYISGKEKYKQTIVFALNIDNAIALNKLFRQAGIKSDYVVSDIKDAITGITVSSKENQSKINKFKNDELEVLINVNILTEGTDIPKVQSIFLARETNSSILMTQMIGRGLRGLKAGGTKEAYIISFVDEWSDNVSWVNPEKLFIEENTNFNDKDRETKKRILRLIAISKIEEFAILTNKIIDPEKKKELENLSFIERFPVGIYSLRFLEKHNDSETIERTSEVLIYDNILKSYTNLIKALPKYFKNKKLINKDELKEKELIILAKEIEEKYFYGVQKYPAYNIQDIKDILKYFLEKSEIPPFIEFKDRDKYNIDKIAKQIIEKDLGQRAETELRNKLWTEENISWQVFFNYDKKRFDEEIDLAKRRINSPDFYKKEITIPIDSKEAREYEKLTLYQIRKINQKYGEWLKKEVLKNFTDDKGFYFCARTGYKSKNLRDFQIDHIKPMHNGGLTILENLQLLTRKENAKKGINP